MATLKIFLDTRATRGDESKAAPLLIAVCHQGSTSYINLNTSLLPKHWDAKKAKAVSGIFYKATNSFLRHKLLEAELALIKIEIQLPIKKLTAYPSETGRLGDGFLGCELCGQKSYVQFE